MSFSAGRSKFLARLRSEYPLVFFIPGLILGQLLSHLLGSAGLIVLALWLFAALCLGPRLRQTLLIALSGLLPGFLSMLSVLGRGHAPALSVSESYLGQVSGPARFRKEGQLEMPIKILGRISWRKGVVEIASFPPKTQPLALCRAVHLPWKNLRQVKLGSLLSLKAKFTPLAYSVDPLARENTLIRHGYKLECRVQYASRPFSNGEPFLARARTTLFKQVIGVLGDNERSGLVLAMAFGRRDGLSTRSEKAFKDTGLAHLLVLSGCQVTLVYYTVCLLLRFCLLRMPGLYLVLPVDMLCRVCALVVATLFVALAGVEASSLRAVLALLFVVAAGLLERNHNVLACLAASFVMLAWLWPGSYLEPSTQLTYGALFGIWLGLGAGRRRAVWTYLKSCLCASLCTSLVLIFWFRRLALAGFVLNPVLVPLASFIGCQGAFAATALSFLPLPGLHYGLKAIGAMLNFFRVLVINLAGLPGTAFKIEGVGRLTLATVLIGGLIFVLFIGRVRGYRDRQNL